MSAKGVEKSTKRGSALGNDRPIRGKALNIYIYIYTALQQVHDLRAAMLLLSREVGSWGN